MIRGASFSDFIDQVTSLGHSLEPTHWAIISVAAILVGYFCLKGMNIR